MQGYNIKISNENTLVINYYNVLKLIDYNFMIPTYH